MNDSQSRRLMEYFARYESQIPVIGEAGQQRLGTSRVHISGFGRIGSQIALQAAAVGIGCVTGNDPQVLEQVDLGAFVFTRRGDVGKPKARALEQFLDGFPGFSILTIVAPTESNAVDPYIASADLVISCANTVAGRLAAERKAIEHRRPVIQVAAFDHAYVLGGLITVWQPNQDVACYGCLLAPGLEFPRGEGLLSTATTALAGMASTMAVQLLTGVQAEHLARHNVFVIDLQAAAVDAIPTARRPGCDICGAL